MSSINSVTNLTSTSIHSVATEDLPPVCSDSNCTYPFGPACDACSFALDVKERGKRRCRPSLRTEDWVEEVQINRHIVLHAGEQFSGGADETNEPNSEAEIEVEVDDDRVSRGGIVSELEDDGYVADTETDFDFVHSSHSTLPLRPSNRAYSDHSSFLRRASSSSSASLHIPQSESLTPWLDTIFDNTLQGQVNEVHFSGGADVAQHPHVDKCKFCGRPIGKATDQHYLKCKFAHEERDRVAKWGSAWGSA